MAYFSIAEGRFVRGRIDRQTPSRMPPTFIPLAVFAVWVALVAPLSVGVARATESAPPSSGSDATTPPEPKLRLAPVLVPPPLPPAPAAKPGAPPAAPPPPTAPLQIAPFGAGSGTIFLRAEDVGGIAEKYVEASGKVELRTRTETVLADWLKYDFMDDEVWAKGNVTLRRGVDWITGPEARFKRGAETGFFASPKYFIAESGGRGDATKITFLAPELYDLTNARYTTCVAPNEDWYISVNDLEIDKARMVGTGHGATVTLLNMPLAYTPWIEFPLSNDRKTGFLTPTMGSSGTRGFDFTQPYYINLAPNYDATLIPRIMTKRGFQIGGQFRYLFETFQGEIDAEILPHDRITGTDRWGFSWRHNESLAPGLTGFWNLNKVSDDTYFTDLSDRVALTSQTTLPMEGGFVYTRGPWQVIAQAQSFQTLQDPTVPPVTPPYNREPQVLATLHDTNWLGLTWAGTSEYAYFREPPLPAGQPPLPTGQRVYAWPTVAWSREGTAWNFIAKTGVQLRAYNLNNVLPGADSTLTYAIPVSSLDGGLVFERDWNAFGQNFVQTLEPRAFYVYAPFRDQSAAPVFDTAQDDFNFAQLFSVNRYLGEDRVGDANQLTVALTSRLLDSDYGVERLRVSIGQRFYFQDQRVVLNEVPRSANSSDILGQIEGRISDAWAITGLLQQNLDSGQTERVTAGFRYTPAPGKVFNASYRYSIEAVDTAGLATELNQFDFSGQWPLDANWTLLGRWNYSIFDHKTLEGVAGIEYNGGCWVLRLVGQRLTTTTTSATTSVYLQIELNGLARIGTSPLDMLRRSVPGYQKTNDPTVSPRQQGDYFTEF